MSWRCQLMGIMEWRCGGLSYFFRLLDRTCMRQPGSQAGQPSPDEACRRRWFSKSRAMRTPSARQATCVRLTKLPQPSTAKTFVVFQHRHIPKRHLSPAAPPTSYCYFSTTPIVYHLCITPVISHSVDRSEPTLSRACSLWLPFRSRYGVSL